VNGLRQGKKGFLGHEKEHQERLKILDSILNQFPIIFLRHVVHLPNKIFSKWDKHQIETLYSSANPFPASSKKHQIIHAERRIRTIATNYHNLKESI